MRLYASGSVIINKLCMHMHTFQFVYRHDPSRTDIRVEYEVQTAGAGKSACLCVW